MNEIKSTLTNPNPTRTQSFINYLQLQSTTSHKCAINQSSLVASLNPTRLPQGFRPVEGGTQVPRDLDIALRVENHSLRRWKRLLSEGIAQELVFSGALVMCFWCFSGGLVLGFLVFYWCFSGGLVVLWWWFFGWFFSGSLPGFDGFQCCG